MQIDCCLKILVLILLTLTIGVSHLQHTSLESLKSGIYVCWSTPKPNVVCLHLLSLPVCVRLCPCLCASPYLFYLSIRDATSDLICSSRANWNLYSASRCGHCPRWKGDSPFLSPPLFGNVMNFMLLPPPVQKPFFPPLPGSSFFCGASPPILQFINSQFICQSVAGEWHY